jgi:hypothetical protein
MRILEAVDCLEARVDRQRLGRALGHGFRASTRLNPETLPVCHEAIDPTSAIEIVEKIIWKMNEWNVADSLKL